MFKFIDDIIEYFNPKPIEYKFYREFYFTEKNETIHTAVLKANTMDDLNLQTEDFVLNEMVNFVIKRGRHFDGEVNCQDIEKL